MKIGDVVVEPSSTGVIVGMSVSGDWIVEWTYNGYSTDPELAKYSDSQLLVIDEAEIGYTVETFPEVEDYTEADQEEVLLDLLAAADSVDGWWHQQEKRMTSGNLVHEKLCEAMDRYYLSIGK